MVAQSTAQQRKVNFHSNNVFPSEKVKKYMLQRTPLVTSGKLLFALSVMAVCFALMYARDVLPLAAPLKIAVLLLAGLVTGLMAAHVTELQHELLHGHAFESRVINRMLGFVCGAYMISSYSQYRNQHLLHHLHIGTSKNTEFFEYPKSGLDSPFKLVRAALNPARFPRVLRLMARAMCDGSMQHLVSTTDAARETAQEYAAYGVLVALGVAYSVVSRDATLLYFWALPLVLVSEPVHFLIELPEHFGLDAYGNTNLFENTRTIESNWLAWWFTNGNNLHSAHHAYGRISMAKSRKLDRLIRADCKHVDKSYTEFFGKVVSGELKPLDDGRITFN